MLFTSTSDEHNCVSGRELERGIEGIVEIRGIDGILGRCNGLFILCKASNNEQSTNESNFLTMTALRVAGKF